MRGYTVSGNVLEIYRQSSKYRQRDSVARRGQGETLLNISMGCSGHLKTKHISMLNDVKTATRKTRLRIILYKRFFLVEGLNLNKYLFFTFSGPI